MSFPCEWWAELERLALKYSQLGVTADLALLTYADAYALLSWLRAIEAGT